MSRRKRNSMPSGRLVGAEIQQLSWNIEINNRLQDNNDSVIVSDTHCDMSMSNCQVSTAEIQNVYSSDDDIGTIFYKLPIYNEEYKNDSAGVLGYLSVIQGLTSTGNSEIEETNIVVKVHKSVGKDNAHGDPSETTSFDEKLCSGKEFVNVLATYEQIDSLSYLCKKGIITVVTDINDQSKVMVFLGEEGFTAVSIPSEDPSMGKAHKSMKILMQWLHGPLLPDIEYQLKTHYDDQIESVFNTLKSRKSCLASTSTADNNIQHTYDLDKFQHPSLVPLLRSYQKRAVYWMIEQETLFGKEKKLPHPLWKSISIGDRQACYNPHTGRICRDQIYHQGYPSGGILADEMGLGKTVEVLACILNNPRQSEITRESNEMMETESDNSLSNSPSTSISASDEKESLMKDDDCQMNVCDRSLQKHNETKQPTKSQLFEQTTLNEVKSISLPSADASSTEINVNNLSPHVTVEASLSNSPLGLFKTDEKLSVGKVMKRSLPLDINQHGKKAKMKSCDILSLHHNINDSSSVMIQPDIINKSCLPSGSVVFNMTAIEKKMECNTESARKIVENEKRLRCICGQNKTDPKEQVFTCTNCGLSQHPQCIGLKKNNINEKYVCPDCSVKLPLLECNTTLIVSPVTIAHQWLVEIHRHILPGSLNVMIYEGVAKQGFIYPSVLAENDIILTTYDVLKRDFHHLPSQKDNHDYRRPKRYPTWPCPLTCIKFWRICLDEAQMVENTTAKTTETALNLSAVHRWCITGTPIQKTIDDLHGLFLFLGVEPYYRKRWWKKLLYEPFMRGNSKALSDVLYNIMWRTAKKDVIDEINLPEQKESMNWLNFSPVEYHFYRRQHEECSRSALKELNKFQESETELNSLDRYSVHRVLWPLLKLRQACCHPQAVRGGYLAVQKSVITMDQLLESLINKAKNESQDAHRQLLCALNGLAGTYILQENWQNAVDVYREAMASWKEHDELFKTDSLQKLHTLHNLHDVLSKFNSNTRTLRDDFLQKEASELKEKYLLKWKDQVTAAKNDAFNAWETHEELKGKVDLKCPWWMTYLQDIINRKNPGDENVSERLIDKIKTDLTVVRNVQEHGSISMADSFSNLRGLQLLLVQKFQAVEDCQNNLFKELKSLMVEPTEEMVVSVAECCLRPATKSTAKSCCFCQVNDILSVYESLIFGHQGIKNNDAESIGGLRAETEATRTLKSIYAFLKSESKRHYKYHLELQEQAQCHLEYLDLIKKKFKVYRQLWHALRQRVSALDELAMCTMRLRLRFPGEDVPDNQFYIVNPTEVETTQMGFRSDKTLANSSLRKSLGQLLYLKNLAKTQSTDDGENSELCPVCTKILGYEWSVFSCGHCLCCQCMWSLLESPGIPGRASANVRCPMCRANTMVQDISYVSTVRNLNEQDKDLVVKGSHSTKIEAAVRTLMRIQKTDPRAKTLVFSTWQDVLDVISRALRENNMKFRSIKKSKDFESSLDEFKTSDDIPILLIPLQSGSNGLNIIEATHVILVEPSLNPSLERQAVGRIHRIGQTKPTFIHRLLIASTVEEKIMRFLQNKAGSGLRCGTRRTDRENIPLTVGELAGFFQPTEESLAM